MTPEDVKRKMLALKSMIDDSGASAGEKSNALYIFQKLQEKYGIKDSDLKNPIVSVAVRYDSEWGQKGFRFAFGVVSAMCGCANLYTTGVNFSIYGEEDDVILANYLCDTVYNSFKLARIMHPEKLVESFANNLYARCKPSSQTEKFKRADAFIKSLPGTKSRPMEPLSDDGSGRNRANSINLNRPIVSKVRAQIG